MIAKRMVLAFFVPILIGVALILTYDFIVPRDPNLIYLPNGIALTPYDNYGPRDIDFYYGLLIVVIFALGVFLPVLLWYRHTQRRL